MFVPESIYCPLFGITLFILADLKQDFVVYFLHTLLLTFLILIDSTHLRSLVHTNEVRWRFVTRRVREVKSFRHGFDDDRAGASTRHASHLARRPRPRPRSRRDAAMPTTWGRTTRATTPRAEYITWLSGHWTEIELIILHYISICI